MLGDFLPREMFKESAASTLFLLSWIYTVLGIVIARIIFPTDPSLAGVAFTCMLLLSDKKIVDLVDNISPGEGDLKSFLIYHAPKYVQIMLAIFMGVLTIHIVASIMMPSYQTNELFKMQLGVTNDDAPSTGMAENVLMSIFINNTTVLLVIFAISMFIRGGGLFLFIWNASTWGTIFGYVSIKATTIPSLYPFVSVAFFLAMLLIFSMPHMLLEIYAYTTAIGAGRSAFISDIAAGRKKDLKKVVLLVIIAILLLLVAACIESYLIEANISGLIRNFVARL